ncbi:DoxX family protein [Iamia sp. SCSIO 61187]|uniref:DoxX family protein n=1 Tax=Iamia sp. SCSIO 61187 TaxID=2722752 RepID=UPI001C634A23|nr:DoxX family protein [Iamia sp. SCSIO 61187]QYG91729.1 DoxX family protein [Iamia sp. SCSIO 61187]
MSALDLVVTSLTAAANLAIGVAGIARADPVVANARAVHVEQRWVPTLGALKALGALGLIAGLAGPHAVGIAAAAGLVVFFVGAVAFHVRAGELATIGFPGTFLALAVASLALALAR